MYRLYSTLDMIPGVPQDIFGARERMSNDCGLGRIEDTNGSPDEPGGLHRISPSLLVNKKDAHSSLSSHNSTSCAAN
jgi:hypothetical protein